MRPTVTLLATLAVGMILAGSVILPQLSSATRMSSQEVLSARYSSPRASIAATDSNVYVSWWDNRTTGNNEIFFARSTDNGQTFGEAINLSNSADLRSIGARIAAQGDYVYISWVEINPETAQRDVFVRTSSDQGETFAEPIKLTLANSTTNSPCGASG